MELLPGPDVRLDMLAALFVGAGLRCNSGEQELRRLGGKEEAT